MGSEPGIWVLERTHTLAFSSNLPPTGSAPLASPWRGVSVLDRSWELRWGQEGAKIGWRQRDVMKSTVWLCLDGQGWFTLPFPRPLSSLDPRALLDAELRGSAVCLALGRGMRSDSFLAPLDVLGIWKALWVIWTVEGFLSLQINLLHFYSLVSKQFWALSGYLLQCYSDKRIHLQLGFWLC